jgi:hypothetical protein
MYNIYTDATLKKHVAAIKKVDPEDLWKELHDVGLCFALFGAMSEALDVWRFAYSGAVPMPDPDDRTVSVYGDGAISSVCYCLKLPDISKGKPAPTYAPPRAKLEARVQSVQARERQMLTCDAWSPAANWDNPPPEMLPTALYRQARLLSYPPEPGQFSSAEPLALALLKRVLSMPADGLIPHHRALALVQAADILARQGEFAEARDFLSNWYDFVLDAGTLSISEPFVLTSLTALLCDGALSAKSSLSENARGKLVQDVVSQLKKRLSKPEPSRPTPTKYKIYVSYSQFYLEPLKPDSEFTYFQEDGESEQGFSAVPGQVAIGTPPNAGECTVEIEFKSRMPPLGKVVQAVVVPLRVSRTPVIFLRTVDDSGKKNRFDVPIGNYDVLARFYPHKLKRYEDSCLTSWSVRLTFLPAGTVGPKCFKVHGATIPSQLVIHDRNRVPVQHQN